MLSTKMLQPGENILELSAHVYGNYHKYYTFHPAGSRLQLLEGRGIFHNLWKAQSEPTVFRILDIGCNEGQLSVEMLQLARRELPADVRCELVGVDIDSSLIELATTNHTLQAPNLSSCFFAVDFLDETSIDTLKAKLPHAQEGFQLVTVFSTTMWIHINHGDSGLQKFLVHAQSFVGLNGAMLLEPQPTKCYRTAVKRCRKLGLKEPAAYRTIQPEKAEETVQALTLEVYPYKHVCYLGHEMWGRALNLFTDFDLVDILPPKV